MEQTPDPTQFAKRLHEALDRKHFVPRNYGRTTALHRLAQEVDPGITSESVRRWLSGANAPSTVMLLRLAQRLDVNALWLATGEGPRREVSQARLSRTERAWLEVMRDLPRELHQPSLDYWRVLVAALVEGMARPTKAATKVIPVRPRKPRGASDSAAS
jgi:transcriptional regulator with XRE-family HTH domain